MESTAANSNEVKAILRRTADAIASGNAAALAPGEVSLLLEAYPYFSLPAANLLASDAASLTDDEAATLRRVVALNAANPTVLYMLLEPGQEAHAGFYPDERPVTPTTENAIDSFLATYGTTSPEEEAILNRMIFNPTPDYSQILSRQEQESAPEEGEAEAGSQDELINRFIIEQKESAREQTTPQPIPAETVEARKSDEAPATTPPEDVSLRESLAKIFIKQRQYSRAYEIIEQLNLNFPEKSVYFADQLRFLRKLMVNEAAK